MRHLQGLETLNNCPTPEAFYMKTDLASTFYCVTGLEGELREAVEKIDRALKLVSDADKTEVLKDEEKVAALS